MDRQEDLDRESLSQVLVLSHLFPPIIGQRFTQQSRNRLECLREARTGTPCIRSGHSGQNDQVGRPLDQGPDGRPIASPLDQVAFPMAGHGTSGHLGRALGNRRHVRDLAASLALRLRHPAADRPELLLNGVHSS